MKPRPVLRYHGGKWLLAPWIISYFPPHHVYVEPFGGAASALMRKKRARVEVYNDLWAAVVNVFRVLRDPETANELAWLLYLTPFARDEYSQTSVDKLDGLSSVEAARRMILRSFAGFGSASTNGAHSTGFRAVSAKTAPKAAANWANYPAQIQGFVERLRGVAIENRPALDVIRQYDSLDTLFYLDPPYPLCTRNLRRGNAMYAHELTDDDHACDLYDQLFADWTKLQTEHVIDGGNKRLESTWLNHVCVAKMPAALLPIDVTAQAF